MKRTFRRTSLLLTALALFAGLLPALAHAASYSFVKIADSNTPRPGGGGALQALRVGGIAEGNVAFTATQDLYVGNGGPVTPVYQNGDPSSQGNFGGATAPGMDNGVIAISGSFGSRTGMFALNSCTVTPIARVGDPAPSGVFNFVGNSSTGDAQPPRFDNSGGTVAFIGDYGNPFQSGIFAGAGSGLTTIAKSGDPAPVGVFAAGASVFATPSISADKVAFTARYPRLANPTGTTGLFVGSGGPLTLLLKTEDPAPIGTFNELNTPSIEGNTVAFGSRYGSSGLQISVEAVMTLNGGTLTTIAKSTDPSPWGTFGLSNLKGSKPSLVGGYVAFYATEPSDFGNQGVFIGNGGPLTTVIKTGDSLFGGTVIQLRTTQFLLDANGTRNVAFSYTLNDFTSGVAMAVFIPEPATGGLLLCALVSCGILRRTRLAERR